MMMQSLLNTIQRFTRTDVRYLLKGGFWVTLSYLIQVVIGFVTTVALANLLPKEALGTYQFIMSLAAILSVMTLSGLGTAITRSVALGNDGVLRSGVYTKLMWSIGTVLGSGLTSLYYYLNDNTLLATSFLIVGALAPFIESFKLYENYLHGKKAFRDSMFLGAWRKPLPLIVLLATIYFTDNVITIVLAYFVSNTISYLAVYAAVIKKYKPPTTTDIATITQAKHLSLLKLLSTAGAHVDKLLIWNLLGAAAVASFTVAQLATRYSAGLLTSMSSLILPKAAQRDLHTLQKTLPHKIFIFTIFMTLGAFIYVLIAPFIFKIAFPEFPESIAISQLLAISFLLIPRTIYGQVLIAHDLRAAQYILSISTFIISITLLWILIPKFGVWGAAYAILGSQTITAIIGFILFKRA